MVDLEALAQPAQDRDRVLQRRLVDDDRLEAALQRGVLLDRAVLAQRRRADAVQLAAGEHRLEHVAGVHRALCRAGTDDAVQFVDEQQDPALGRLDLGEHRLQPLLELAAVLRACDERAHVERKDRLVLQALGDVRAQDPLREPLDDRGLADAGVADEHGVVLRLARQDLDDAADLGVAPDDRVQQACARLGDEVAAVLLERLVGRLGHRARHALSAADLGQHPEEAVRRQPAILEHLACRRARAQHRQDEVLDGDVLVLQARGLLLGVLEQQREPARDAHVTARARPRHARPRLERLRDVGADRVDVDVGALEQARDQAVGLVEQREQQVLDVDLGVAEAHRLGLRVVDGLLGLLGQPVDVHHWLLGRVTGCARSDASCRSRTSMRASSSLARTAPA